MKDYSEMSDFEINNSIAVLLGITPDEEQYHSYGDRSDGVLHQKGEKIVDYCHDPRDMWPIIVENNIWVQPDMVGDGYWHCHNEDMWSKDKNPLRAAAIVYLMIKDAE